MIRVGAPRSTCNHAPLYREPEKLTRIVIATTHNLRDTFYNINYTSDREEPPGHWFPFLTYADFFYRAFTNTRTAGAAASPQRATAVILTASFDLRFYEYILGMVAITV